VLQVSQLDGHYGTFQALFGVSIDVAEGETVAIIGANGAGKSTLLKSIAGLIPSRDDALTFESEPVGALSAARIAELGIFLVPEGRRIFPSLSVEENLLVGAYTKRSGSWNLEQVYDLFPILKERRRQGGTQLSGGQQQMLAIGRGLMANPRLLLVDEMSLGLAPAIIKDLYGTLGAIREGGTTLLLVEQDIQQAMSVADRIYCLRKGSVVLSGRPDEIDHEALVSAYFGLEA
jgi:branched-chain amino acid transport system ATP-binding protein